MSRKQRDSARDAARDFPPLGFAQIARPFCDACGGALRWMPVRDLAGVASSDALVGIAEHLEAGNVCLDDESWLCDSCGKFGIFSGGGRS